MIAVDRYREQFWRTADGRSVPIKDMDLGHLVNVINWITDNPASYTANTKHLMVAEAENRQPTLFAQGKPYPQQVDNRWVIVDPATGKTGIVPPPKEYLDSVKDNAAYQEMSKNTRNKRVKRLKLDT
jgi:hypothetical protein